MSENVIDITLERVKKMEYLLMPGNAVSKGFWGHHDNAYQLWNSSWQKTFSDLKTDAKLKADDFTRHNIVSALFNGEEAVGLLLHSHYNLNLESVRNHSYISSFPPEIMTQLQSEGRSGVLSMEYLTLSSKWRKATTGIALAEVIVGLGAKIVEASGFSALNVARVDRNVNGILYGYGGRCLLPNVMKHNVQVDLISVDPGNTRPNPNPETSRLVDHFWERRKDAVGVEQLVAVAAGKKVA